MKKKLKIAILIGFILISLLSLMKTVELPNKLSDGYKKEWINTTPMSLFTDLFIIE